VTDVVVVRSAPNVVRVVEQVTRVVVRTPGPQGPPGPPGPAGGATYEHVQSTPAANWFIAHNLGRRVHVTVFDQDDVQVMTDVEHTSLDEVTITFSAPFAGSAVIS
jgi:hypothetical protein